MVGRVFPRHGRLWRPLNEAVRLHRSAMSSPCPKCGQRLGWKQADLNFSCPTCGTSLQSSAPNIAGWVGVFLGPVALITTDDASWVARILALAVAATISIAAGVMFGSVATREVRDAT